MLYKYMFMYAVSAFLIVYGLWLFFNARKVQQESIEVHTPYIDSRNPIIRWMAKARVRGVEGRKGFIWIKSGSVMAILMGVLVLFVALRATQG